MMLKQDVSDEQEDAVRGVGLEGLDRGGYVLRFRLPTKVSSQQSEIPAVFYR